jgi:cation diffusion facilitator family transporter
MTHEDQTAALKRTARRATYLVIGGNLLLLILKASASSVSESLAILSETVNSLTDVFASIAVLICVRLAAKSADEDHPFGHTRAEPIAGLVVAIFAAIMGWEVFRSPLMKLLEEGATKPIDAGPLALPVLIFTVLLKSAMTWYLARTARLVNSPALRASSADCRNDIPVALLAIGGVVFGQLHPMVDALAAMAISLYIFRNAYQVGRENIAYLMGTVPDKELLEEIHAHAAGVPAVISVRSIRAHYVGNFVHVEIDVLLDGRLATFASHEIAERVRHQVETIPAIDRAFVHVEPSTGHPD